MNKVAVIGAGAWGLALAAQAARAGNAVALWARHPATAGARLPGFALPETVRVTGDLPATFDHALVAVPCQHLRAALGGWRPEGALFACAKGVETGTLRLPAEILAELFPDRPVGVLTGPNFAHEVAAGLPAAATLAMEAEAPRAAAIAALATPGFRLYASADTLGAQLGGAAKNVIAIAAGAVMGAGLGENARAALITRGVAELARLAAALGARPETVSGLSGLGDLLLTCTGGASRNYTLGLRLGAGETLAAILAGRSTVTEGVATAPSLVQRAEAAGVDLPICATVADLVAGRAGLPDLVARLLSRQLRAE